ncbi:Unannotated [Lentimonas sp. CC4]|nr:Unannotated [Lentimonas sp. CC4]CAA6683542.1 Unannotated [Lentimonas sp. CC6]CAA7077303.1 Unannotated [Lentimonas sp. CC4]CAA7170182.1 Unannotated [Lentimonas sp. CC21]CAA7182430.1 Unannotated [Lentimonas sp. CC8]
MEKDADTCPACYNAQGYRKEIISLCITVAVLLCVAFVKVGGVSFVVNSEAVRNFVDQTSEPVDTSSLRVAAINHDQYYSTPTAQTQRLISFEEFRSRPQTHRSQKVSHASSATYQGTKFQQAAGQFPFYVAEKSWDPNAKRYTFLRKGMNGTEVVQRGDNRRYFISENQSEYPQSESGCGPTALLNLYIWYTKFGLLKESIQHSNYNRYKQLKFREIDRKLLNIQRESRNAHGGTNALEQVVVMDELIQSHSRSGARLHFEIKRAPLALADFLDLSTNYRVGILSVRPKSLKTGKLMGNHAVLVIRGDTSGKITIANWGAFSHGRLVQRDGAQWFIPDDTTQHSMRINQLTTLIPFVPKA